MQQVLLADITGSGFRFAIQKESRSQRPVFALVSSEFAVGEHTLSSALRAYVEQASIAKLPAMFAASVSAPATGDLIEIAGHREPISKQAFREEFGFETAYFMNDSAMIAAALPWLDPTDTVPIGQVDKPLDFQKPEGRYALVSANEGVGAAALRQIDGHFQFIDSEAGHTAFAPSSGRAADVLRVLQNKYDFVSNEMMLSPSGLSAMYQALCRIRDLPADTLSPIEIAMYGGTGTDRICVESLDLYVEILASFGGDLALSVCAVDGIFYTGEAVAAVADAIDPEKFRNHFCNKGRFSHFVSNIPTYMITNPSVRLIGLSHAVREKLTALETGRSKHADPATLLKMITRAVDQSITIVDSNLKIVANSERAWYDAPISVDAQKDVFITDLIKAMGEEGQFGLIDRERAYKAIADKFQRQAAFSYQRTTFSGRKLSAVVAPTDLGGFVIVETDITDRDKRTKQLESLASELRAAKARSDEASRSKSEFLANMSHEIRTPLNGVLGMADVLQRTTLSADQLDMLRVIITSGNSLLTVINDILDFSKVEAGKMRLAPEPFLLTQCIEDVGSLFSTQAEQKNLELMVKIHPDTPTKLIGDVGRIRQVLLNIVGNALKFTNEGYILISVEGQEKGEFASLKIDVTDTGVGIPEDKLDAVFNMFEQIDGSSTRSHEGTGLGLSITRRILELMGGSISAKSKLGEGSTFSIELELPLSEAHIAAPRCALTESDLRGRRVLVVDDQPVNRQILAEQLRAWQVEPVMAANAADALSTLDRFARDGLSVDAAVLDYQMPKIDGLELARTIRQTGKFRDLPLILLTSVGHVNDSDSFAAFGFSGYLVKPARTSQLLAEIAKAVAQRSAPGTAAQTPLLDASPDAALTPAPPPAEVSPPMSAAGTDIPVAERHEQPAPKRLRVLVAEDNPINQMVIRSMLANDKYDVLVVEDGLKAVEAFEAQTPDIVLMDVSMPVLDGYDATQKIREIEKRRKAPSPTPIIAVTAHALADDCDACLASGMTGYISKPVTQESLENVIRLNCA